jgi:hypothetical protein
MSVKVTVKCEIEIPIGLWNINSTFEELAKIAKKEGLEKLHKLVRDIGGRVIGEPKPVMTVMEE